ncbi:MAG: alpha/beta fold hydrolase [Gemmatimonadota bacterium]
MLEPAARDNPEAWEPEPFRPAHGLRGPHAQTLAGKILRSRSRLLVKRERLDTPDGDFLDLDFAQTHLPDSAPCALLLHGLGGSSESGYMRRTGAELKVRGIRSVALNFRSASGEPNRMVRSYHSGETGDLAFVLRYLQDRFPSASLGAVGFSLGGNVLLKFLAEQSQAPNCPLRAAASVSVPFGLAASSEALEHGGGGLYGKMFLRSLKRCLKAKSRLFPNAYDMAGGLAARTVWEFDERITAPVHGFRDAADYYAQSSSGPRLHQIRIPSLLLLAADDPFVPRESVPTDGIAGNKMLTFAYTEYGGHLGFVDRPGRQSDFWCDREAARFLAARLAYT